MSAHHIGPYLSINTGSSRQIIRVGGEGDMMSNTSAAGGSGRYEIRLKRHLHSRWATWFDALTLTTRTDGTTTIHGPRGRPVGAARPAPESA